MIITDPYIFKVNLSYRTNTNLESKKSYFEIQVTGAGGVSREEDH
jgi:hypothetical protein